MLGTHTKSVQSRGAGPTWAYPNLSHWQLRGGSSGGAGREKAGMEHGLQRIDLDAEQRLCREEASTHLDSLARYSSKDGYTHSTSTTSQLPPPLGPPEKVEVEDHCSVCTGMGTTLAAYSTHHPSRIHC